MPKGRTFFASGTGTYHVKIRFMSAQRGKKTRSAASRYRRYVRLTGTTVELRLQFRECHPQKEESKDTLSEKSVQSVGVRVHTPPRLHYLRYGWASGSVLCLCRSEGDVLRSQALCGHAVRTSSAQARKIGGLIAGNTPNAHRMHAKHLSQVSHTDNLLPPVVTNNFYREFALSATQEAARLLMRS